MKTIYYKARQKKSNEQPSLKDRRALYYDNIGISINELIKLETDEHYIPHPTAPSILIEYYQDFELAKAVCDDCLITKTVDSLNLKSKKLKIRNVSQFLMKGAKAKIHKRVLKENINKKSKKTFYYYTRLRLSLEDHLFSDRYYVANCSGVNYALLTKVENVRDYTPRFETSNSLLRFYKDTEFAKQICINCPVNKSIKKLNERKESKCTK